MIWLSLMYPPFLTSMLTSKGLHSYFWKGSLRSFIGSQEIFTPPKFSFNIAVTLASLIPITEEHIKLLDCLSEPLSQLIHCISHPGKEDISAEVVTVFYLHSCPQFCKLHPQF